WYDDAVAKPKQVTLEAAGREVVVTNPDKVYFPETGYTKLQLVSYYQAVAEGALRGIANRPIVLKRYVNGAAGEFFFQKRAPDIPTSKWWKEERKGVFLDYNQNAKDRTVASQYSVRPTKDARVSMPLRWEEVPTCDPAAFTLATVPALFAERGDASVGMDDA